MTRIKYLILLLLFPCVTVFSQKASIKEKLDLSGYYENRFFPQEVGDEFIFQDYNKLRINIASDISTKITFNANVNFQTYHGKTSFCLFDFMPERTVNSYASALGQTPDALRPYFNMTQNDTIFLDNAYLSIYTKYLNLRIGKQQLPWGTGYAWNPTDIFNAKNILDPTYEKTGVNAFKVEVPFLQNGMITGIVSIADNWENTTQALMAKYNVAGFDIALKYANKEQNFFDSYAFTTTTENRQMLGGDVSGSIAGVGIWGEAAYNIMESRSDYGQYVAGADYTFMNGLYLMAEYYYNDLGETSSDNYTFDQWVLMLSEDAENMGKNYIYVGQMYPIADLINWSNYFMLNLNDGSGMIFPWVDFSLGDNVELNLVGYFPFGKKETEYGEYGMGGFARIRVYL